MTRYEITETDKKLIEIGLEVLKQNFDDGISTTRWDALCFAKTAIFTRV